MIKKVLTYNIPVCLDDLLLQVSTTLVLSIYLFVTLLRYNVTYKKKHKTNYFVLLIN